MQAQEPFDPYFRAVDAAAGLRPDELGELIEQARRRAARSCCVRRSTWSRPRDCLGCARSCRVAGARVRTAAVRAGIRSASTSTRSWPPARELLDERPADDRGSWARLGERWPERDAAPLGYAVRFHAAAGAGPAAGLWGAAGRGVAHDRRSGWAGRWRPMPRPTRWSCATWRLSVRPPSPTRGPGPGSPACARSFERLRPGLRTFRDERGRELFDLPDGPLPGPETPAPVAVPARVRQRVALPQDRSRIVDRRHPERLTLRENGYVSTVLVDGFVRAIWKPDPDAAQDRNAGRSSRSSRSPTPGPRPGRDRGGCPTAALPSRGCIHVSGDDRLAAGPARATFSADPASIGVSAGSATMSAIRIRPIATVLVSLGIVAVGCAASPSPSAPTRVPTASASASAVETPFPAALSSNEPYAPAIDPETFVEAIDNPYLPLQCPEHGGCTRDPAMPRERSTWTVTVLDRNARCSWASSASWCVTR